MSPTRTMSVVVAILCYAILGPSRGVAASATTLRRLPVPAASIHRRQSSRRAEDGPSFDLPPVGIWTSRGYGYVLQVPSDDASEVNALEETAISCIILDDEILEEIDPEVVDPDVLVLDVGTNVAYLFDRTDNFTSGCAAGFTPVAGDANYVRDPLTDFDIFVQTFKEHYAFFDLRGIDWESAAAQARTDLSASSTDEELFEVLASLLGPLDDSHVFLESDQDYFGSKPFLFDAQLDEEFEEQTTVTDPDLYINNAYIAWDTSVAGYMEDGLNQVVLDEGGSPVLWGYFANTSQTVGYIRFVDFGFEDEDIYYSQLDKVFLGLANAETLVVDVRVNYGGGDVPAVGVASYFASEPTLAYRLSTVNGDGFTEAFDVTIEPGDPTYRFNGDVIVIISGSTVSAGETFVLAMGQLPQTTFLGRDTAGAFSDTLERSLPNGWLFGGSNEVVEAPDGTLYEMIGYPPDIVPVADLIPLEEREAGIDSWLELALEVALSGAGDNSTTASPVMVPSSSPVLEPTTSGAGNEFQGRFLSLWETCCVASLVMWTLF